MLSSVRPATIRASSKRNGSPIESVARTTDERPSPRSTFPWAMKPPSVRLRRIEKSSRPTRVPATVIVKIPSSTTTICADAEVAVLSAATSASPGYERR